MNTLSETNYMFRHNIADSVTSISCGLLMTMVGLFSKVLLLLYLFFHFSNKITTCHIMNHRQLVFQPMPGSTLTTGSLLFRLCPFSFLYNSSSLLLWNGFSYSIWSKSPQICLSFICSTLPSQLTSRFLWNVFALQKKLIVF